MAETIADKPASPSEAATPELNPSALTDEALKAIFGENADTHPDDALIDELPDEDEKPAEAAKAAEAAKPAEAEKPAEEVPTGIDLKLLDDEKTPEAKPLDQPVAVPEDEYVAQVRQWIPNKDMLGTVVQGFQQSNAFDNALQQKNAPAIFQALGNAKAEQLIETIYQTYKEKIVDRFLDEQKAITDPQHPEVTKLQAKVAELDNYIQSGIQREASATQKSDHQAKVQFINTTIGELFDTIRFPNDDTHASQRELLKKATYVDLTADPKLLERALKGGADGKAAIRLAFKPNVEKFIASDKPKTLAVQQKRDQQEQKPKPVPAGAGATAVAAEGELSAYQRAANHVAAEIRRRK